MACSMCLYRSDKLKVYTEVQREGPGYRGVVPNVGIQVGLSQSMISYTACRRILMAAHIPAPSRSTMQTTAYIVHDKIIKTNESDMSECRKQLHDNNEAMGLPRDSPIRVEADGHQNNAVHSGSEKTPFQAGTQAVYKVVEKQTSQKQVIAVETRNKMCTSAQRPRNLGQNVVCPDHRGKCTATAALQILELGMRGKWLWMCK